MKPKTFPQLLRAVNIAISSNDRAQVAAVMHELRKKMDGVLSHNALLADHNRALSERVHELEEELEELHELARQGKCNSSTVTSEVNTSGSVWCTITCQHSVDALTEIT